MLTQDILFDIIQIMKQQSLRIDKAETLAESAYDHFQQQPRPSNNNETTSTLKALLFKSVTLQSRSYCSNICQIITPILCLLFTLAVRQIVNGITTGAVKQFQYPQYFNMPIFNNLIKPEIGLICEEVYYYQNPMNSQKWVNKIIKMQLRQTCPKTQFMNPQFIKKQSVNKGVIECLDRADKLNFERGDDLNTEIPDGIVKFKNITQNTISATFGINDFRLPEYHKNNGVTKILMKTSVTTTISTYLRVTEGMMSLIDKISRPFLQLSSPKQIIAGSFVYMPFSGQDKTFVSKMINVLGSGLYPLGLSLLLPIFLYMVVSQKQQRQLEIMKMNGLEIKYYWVNFFVISFILTMIASLNMYIMGLYVIQIDFFAKTSGVIIWTMFIGWAIAQISMTVFFQIFINNSKSATIIGYILSIFSTLLGVTICTVIFPYPMTLPFYLLMYPPFALSRLVYHIGLACADSQQCFRSIYDVNSEVSICFAVLFCWFFIFLFSIWLNQVVQQEFGVAQRPLIIQKCLRLFKKQKKEVLMEELETFQQKNDINSIEMSNMQNQRLNRSQQIVDESVNREYHEAMKANIFLEPLLIRELSMKYETDNGEKQKVALKPLSFRLTKGDIFGFLGPNGAGKTTLISVLTGMYPQSSGSAWMYGNLIGLSKTNKMIGVCPQFDILWKDLTIEQHLIFYSRLKNIPEDSIEGSVKQSLSDVDLFENRHLKAKQLSGGMQRRLSIAIALVGKPSVIFLDEPSSGLDPFHRRQIWDILQKCKRKTSIFLTSHLMDEVQFLCDRIGIINQGSLKCIGQINELKQKYGQGYRLTISYNNILRQNSGLVSKPKIVQDLIDRFSLIVQNELETRVILKIQKNDIQKCASILKDQHSLDWSISQPSLYDVFTHFVK